MERRSEGLGVCEDSTRSFRQRSGRVPVAAVLSRRDGDEASSGGALTDAQAGNGEAHTQLILPEHERTVQRYFERGKK